MTMYGIVYSAFDTTNGKFYVGQTWYSLHQRSSRHIRDAISNRGKTPFYGALRVHGSENFVWSVLVSVTSQESLDAAEIAFIDQLDSRYPAGYNMTEGGKGGRMRPQTRKKMSSSHIGKIGAWKGKKLSEEHRMRIGQSMTGRICSEESSRKRSASLRAYWEKRRTS